MDTEGRCTRSLCWEFHTSQRRTEVLAIKLKLSFIADFHPEDTNLSTNLSGMIVLVNTSFSLICSARANPPAKYRLYRGQESLLNTTVGQNSVTYTTNVIERIRQVNYSCTPFNFYGDGPTQIVFVTVHCKYM